MYKVAILANLKKNAPKLPGQPPDAWADLDSEKTIEAIAASLRRSGHDPIFLEANVELIDKLREVKPDICFNIAEGHYGDSREAQIPALLELMKIPYTGSRVLTQAISLDKVMTKRVWQSFGLRTAPFQQFTRADEPLSPELRFPLFVKPAREGTGAGVTVQAIVNDERERRERVDYVIRSYEQPALVERYLSGRELTIGVIGNSPHQYIFPPIEVSTAEIAPEERGLYTHHVKHDIDDAMSYLQPAKLPPALLAEVRQMALAGHNAIGSLDVSRTDFRCDEAGIPYLLEINTLPGMSPGFSDLPIAADLIHMGYDWLVSTILNLACQRYSLPAPEPIIPVEDDVAKGRG
jgi:D-alanine-D-alanine ligase